MATAYPGTGRVLNLATYTGSAPALLTYPLTPILADEALSDCEPLNDSLKTSIQITYNVVPTQTTTVQYSGEPTFAHPIILDTLPASATDFVSVWTTSDLLPGFIRIYNTSDVQINQIVVQKVVASFG